MVLDGGRELRHESSVYAVICALFALGIGCGGDSSEKRDAAVAADAAVVPDAAVAADAATDGALAPDPGAPSLQLEPPAVMLLGDGAQLILTLHLAPGETPLPDSFLLRFVIEDDAGIAQRELRTEVATGGTQTRRVVQRWDGRNDGGSVVAAGDYHVVAELIAGVQPSSGEVLARSTPTPLLVRQTDVTSSLVCRLLGHDYHNPATLQPDLRIYGTDQGIPVPIGDKIYFLFGDAWTQELCMGTEDPYVSLASDDLVGALDMATMPDPDACLPLTFPVLPDEPTKFDPILLEYQGAPVELLALGVPSAAFAYEDRFYSFFNPYHPVPCSSDAQCPPPSTCEFGACSIAGLQAFPPRILAVADQVEPWPTRFTGFAEITAPDFSNLAARTVNRIDGRAPEASDYARDAPTELLVFGKAHFVAGLASDAPPWGLYMFRQDLASLASDKRLTPQYFAGLDHAGAPRWSEALEESAPVASPETELTASEGGEPRPIHFGGTMSLTVIPEFGPQRFRWLMTYGGRSPVAIDIHSTVPDPRIGIFFRLAPHPWGPWTPPRRLWSGHSPEGYGTLLYSPDVPGVASDEGRGPRECDVALPFHDVGAEYAPQVIEPFTRIEGDVLTVYWLLSSWNPYRVAQMRSEITLDD